MALHIKNPPRVKSLSAHSSLYALPAMEAAPHADHATVWVNMLRDYTRRLLYPIESGDAFGDTYTSTPEHAYASPAKWAVAAAWMPWWTWAGIAVISTLVYIAVLSIACRGCCGDKPMLGSRLSKKQWSGVIYAFAAVVGAAFVVSAVLTPVVIPRIANAAIGIAEDMHDTITNAVDTTKTLRTETRSALLLAAAWRDAVNQSSPAYTELVQLADELNTTADTAAEIVGQVDRDYSIQDYVDRADNVTWYITWGTSGYVAWLALIIGAVIGLAVYRGLRAPPRSQSDSAVLRKELSCGVGWLSCLGLAFLGSLLLASLVLYVMATVVSGVCYAPYDYVNVFVNSGNLTATTDPDSVPAFYATCTDATHGPVNAKIDTVYAQLDDSVARATALRDALTPSATDALAAQCIGNLTALETTVNSTRTQLDCRRAHEFVERILDQLCDRLPPTFLWITILQFFVALTLPVTLLLVLISYRGDGLGDASQAPANELAPLTPLPLSSSSDRPFG